MSAVKRLMEDLVEHEQEVHDLIKLATEKRPALSKMLSSFPSPNNCTRFLSGLTDNVRLEKLACAAIYWNYNFNT